MSSIIVGFVADKTLGLNVIVLISFVSLLVTWKVALVPSHFTFSSVVRSTLGTWHFLCKLSITDIMYCSSRNTSCSFYSTFRNAFFVN